jgi:hypothetical protein
MKSVSRTGVIPWFIIWAAAVFIPLMILMTFQSLDRQERQIRQLLMEKGEALIRAFEAGARTPRACAGALSIFRNPHRKRLSNPNRLSHHVDNEGVIVPTAIPTALAASTAPIWT